MRGTDIIKYLGETSNSAPDARDTIISNICESRGLRRDFTTVPEVNSGRGTVENDGNYSTKASSLKDYLDTENNAFMQGAFGNEKANLTQRANRYLESNLEGQTLHEDSETFSDVLKTQLATNSSGKSHSTLASSKVLSHGSKAEQKDAKNVFTFGHPNCGPLDRIFSNNLKAAVPAGEKKKKKKHDRRLPTTLAVPHVSCPSETCMRNGAPTPFSSGPTPTPPSGDVMKRLHPTDRQLPFYLNGSQDGPKERFNLGDSANQRDNKDASQDKPLALDFTFHEVVYLDSLERLFHRQKDNSKVETPLRHLDATLSTPDKDAQSPERDENALNVTSTKPSPIAEEKGDYIHRLQRMFSRSKSKSRERNEISPSVSVPKSNISWKENFTKIHNIRDNSPSSLVAGERESSAVTKPSSDSKDEGRLHNHDSMEYFDKIRFKWCGLTSVFANIKPQDKLLEKGGQQVLEQNTTKANICEDSMRGDNFQQDLHKQAPHLPNEMNWKNKMATNTECVFGDVMSLEHDVEMDYPTCRSTEWCEEKARQTLRWLQEKEEDKRQEKSGDESENSCRPIFSQQPAVYPVNLFRRIRSRNTSPEATKDTRLQEKERSQSGDSLRRHVKFSNVFYNKENREIPSSNECDDINLVEALRTYPFQPTGGSSTPIQKQDADKVNSKPLDFSRLSPRYKQWLSRRHKPSSRINTDNLVELKKSIALPPYVGEQINATIKRQKQIDDSIKKQKQIDDSIKKQKKKERDDMLKKQKERDELLKMRKEIDERMKDFIDVDCKETDSGLKRRDKFYKEQMKRVEKLQKL